MLKLLIVSNLITLAGDKRVIKRGLCEGFSRVMAAPTRGYARGREAYKVDATVMKWHGVGLPMPLHEALSQWD